MSALCRVLTIALLVGLATPPAAADIPKQLLCVDPTCRGVISSAITMLRYYGNKKNILSFEPNTKVKVLAKPENPNEKYWGVEINGAYGFVPKEYLKEKSVYHRPKITIPSLMFYPAPDELIAGTDNLNNIDVGNVAYNAQSTEKLTFNNPKDTITLSTIPSNVHEIDATPPQTVIDGTTLYMSESDKDQDHENYKNDHLPAEDESIKNIQSNTEKSVDNTENLDVNQPQNDINEDHMHEYTDVREKKSLRHYKTENLPDGDANVDDPSLVNEDDYRNPTDDEEVAYRTRKRHRKHRNQDDVPTDDEHDNAPTETETIPTTESVNNVNNEFEDTAQNINTEMPVNVEAEQPVDVNKADATAEEHVNVVEDHDAEHTVEADDTKSEEHIDSPDKSIDNTAEHHVDAIPKERIDAVPAETVETVDTTSVETVDDVPVETVDDVPVESVDIKSEESVDLNKAEDGNISSEVQSNTIAEKPIESDEPANINTENLITDSPDNQIIKTEDNNQVDTESNLNKIITDNINNNEPIADSVENNVVELESPPPSSMPTDHTDHHPHNEGSTDIEDSIHLHSTYNDDANVSSENNDTDDLIANFDAKGLLSNILSNHHHHHHDNIGNIPYTDDSNSETSDSATADATTNFYNDHQHSTEAKIEYPSTMSPYFQDYFNNAKPEVADNNLEDNSSEDNSGTPRLPINHNSELPTPDDDGDTENKISFLTNISDIFSGLYEKVFNVFASNNGENNSENIVNDVVQNADEDKHSSSNMQDHISSIFTESLQCNIDDRNKRPDISSDMIFWLVLSAVTVLLFTLGYYYLDNRKHDGKLLAMVNTLQKEMLCSSKENILLKDELTITKDKLSGIEDSSFGSNEMVACLKNEILDAQQTISDLQDKLVIAEEELANSNEAAFDLQAILDEHLEKDTSTSSLTFTITKLQSQLDDQQSNINLTKSQLAGKVEENELLMMKIVEVNNKCVSFEKKLNDTQEILTQALAESETKSKQIQEQASSLEKYLSQSEEQKKLEAKEINKQINAYKEDLSRTKAALKARTQEVQSLQGNIKSLQNETNSDTIVNILDVNHAKSELIQANSEKAILSEKLEGDRTVINELNDKINSQTSYIDDMTTKLSEAEQKALESSTRLEVLTNYFNQKEADLLKELSTKESLWVSQQGEAMSTVEKIESIQKEILQYKEISENMKRELAEQEAAWRTRVAALEQRAHEHWLARRAAERAAEASGREAQTLRQRLSAPSPDAKRVVSPLTTGEVLPDGAFLPPLVPIPGMFPPPPLGYFPPPHGGPMMLPPPPPLTPFRPPPLGRLSSPPPLQNMRQDRAYSPDSRYSGDRAYSPQNRRSPFSNSDSRRRYNNRRYDERYYDSEEERRLRRYETETDFSPVNTLPPSPVPHSRKNHNKGISSGSGQSSESLERFK